MTSHTLNNAETPPIRPIEATGPSLSASAWIKGLLIAALLLVIYWRPGHQVVGIWMLTDSYYTHGFLIPPISAVIVWQRRSELLDISPCPSGWGYVFLAGASALIMLGAFLGFAVFGHLSLVPMLLGIVLTLLGPRHLKLLWFPILFLLFMIPIPPSITQSVTLDLKLFATSCAVGLARLATLPVIHDGSFVHFRNDHLLIGDVCGGLRSLIALLAIGALSAYFSKGRMWARLMTLAISGPIAVAANVSRILLLCVVAYFWGSDVATGTVHDISGVLIFVVAFILFFMAEALLRRLAPLGKPKSEAP